MDPDNKIPPADWGPAVTDLFTEADRALAANKVAAAKRAAQRQTSKPSPGCEPSHAKRPETRWP